MYSIYLAIILGLSFGLSQDQAFAGNNSIPKNYVKLKRKPAVKRKALSLLTIEQIGRLHHSKRVQYINNMREAYVVGHRAQYIFDRYNKKRKNAEASPFWNWLVEEVNANSGYLPGKKCIYGARLISRTNDGRCVQTKEVLPCKTISGQNGATCGFLGSGLSGAYACVKEGAQKNAVNFTKACIDTAKSLTQAFKDGTVGHINSGWKEKVRNDRAKYLNLKNEYEKLVANPKSSLDDRLKVMEELQAFAFDPEVFAHMMKLGADYREKNKPIPASLGSKGSPLSQQTETVVNFQNLSKDKSFFNSYKPESAELDKVWFGFVSYCYSKLNDKDLQKTVKDKTPRSTTSESINAINQLKGRTKDSLQKEECEAIVQKTSSGRLQDVLAAHRNIENDLRGIASTISVNEENTNDLPDTALNQDDIYIEGTAENLDDVEQYVADANQVTQETVEKNGVYYDSFGCEDGLYTESYLQGDTMACFACTAEKDGQRVSGDPNFKVSKKWLTLMNIAAKTCGYNDSVYSNNLKVSQAALMMETFGACSKNSYRWQGDEDANLKELVEFLQKGDLLDIYIPELETFKKSKKISSEKKVTPKESSEMDKIIARHFNLSQTPTHSPKGFSSKSTKRKPNKEHIAKFNRKHGKLFGVVPEGSTIQEHINKKFNKVFGLNYSDMRTFFCPDKRGLLKDKDRALLFGQFANKAQKMPSTGSPVKNELRSCMQEASKMADAAYQPGSQKSCLKPSKSIPKANLISLDRPILLADRKDDTCYSSVSLAHNPKADVTVSYFAHAGDYKLPVKGQPFRTNEYVVLAKGGNETCKGDKNCSKFMPTQFYENSCNPGRVRGSYQTPRKEKESVQ